MVRFEFELDAFEAETLFGLISDGIVEQLDCIAMCIAHDQEADWHRKHLAFLRGLKAQVVAGSVVSPVEESHKENPDE